MQYKFYKYQGAGNDFIIFDNRNNSFPHHQPKLYNKLCDRRFGIGADGVMLLENVDSYDFKMVYYNADGNESTMCGNGGRCLVRFAEELKIKSGECTFLAVDGPHYAKISELNIELKMIDVNNWESFEDYLTIFTGSPHYITWVTELDKVDVYNEGKAIRYNSIFNKEGINVNFLEWDEAKLHVRTYERGVEDETLSCGTGVTAAAMAYSIRNNLNGDIEIPISTRGGELKVKFKKSGGNISEVFLIGPAEKVFEGFIEI